MHFRLFGVALAAMMSTAHAQQATNACTSAEEAINSIEGEFKPRLDKVSRDGEELGKEAEQKNNLKLDFDVTMNEQKWVLDLPSVTMKQQRIVMGLPEITMLRKEFSWHVPEIRMVTKKVGQKPEIVVDGFNVTVRWTDIFMDVPESTMVLHQWSMDIPETRITDVEMILDIPEFRMEREEWYVKIPEFTLKKVEAGGVPVYTDYTKRGEEIEAEADSIKGDMKAELIRRTTDMFGCQRSALMNEKTKALTQFHNAISKIQDSMQMATSQGVPAEQLVVVIAGVSSKLSDQVPALQTKQIETAAMFDAALAKMDAQEKEAVAKIVAG